MNRIAGHPNSDSNCAFDMREEEEHQNAVATPTNGRPLPRFASDLTRRLREPVLRPNQYSLNCHRQARPPRGGRLIMTGRSTTFDKKLKARRARLCRWNGFSRVLLVALL